MNGRGGMWGHQSCCEGSVVWEGPGDVLGEVGMDGEGGARPFDLWCSAQNTRTGNRGGWGGRQEAPNPDKDVFGARVDIEGIGANRVGSVGLARAILSPGSVT